MSCLSLIAIIIASCLSCLGVWGKKCCWYDCFGLKKNNRSVQGSELEIYQALTDMTEELGVRPEKIKAYVEILDEHDVCSKKALFLLSKD